MQVSFSEFLPKLGDHVHNIQRNRQVKKKLTEFVRS